MDILRADKKRHQLQLFTGIAHGFALRGDINNPYDRKSSSCWLINNCR